MTMYLIDTNIWLERLLDQDRSAEVQRLLAALPSRHLALSHFSLHSISIVLGRYRRPDALMQFIDDLFITGNVHLVTVPPESCCVNVESFGLIVDAMTSHHLDFDDAYQYVATRLISGELVSFDADFDRSDLQRLTPATVLARLTASDTPPA
jgi:predicted nucleic acid-binding protein